MALIDDLRSEVVSQVTAEHAATMQAEVETRMATALAEKVATLHVSKENLAAEMVRVDAEIAELTESSAEETTEVTEEPQG